MRKGSPLICARALSNAIGLAVLLGALGACSHGGSTPATAPSIRNLSVTPNLVYASPTPAAFTAQFDFADPNGDLESAQLVITDAAGSVISTLTTPIAQADGITAAQLFGATTALLATPGEFTAHLTLGDRSGLQSNELVAVIGVRAFPWTEAAPRLQPVRTPAAAVLDDRVYLLGGERTDGASVGLAADLVGVYDPAANSWSSLPVLPTARVRLSAATSGGRIYAIGGIATPTSGPIPIPQPTVTGAVEEFDPQQQVWRARAAMPTPRAYAAAAELNGRIIVAGGDASAIYTPFSTRQPMATVESYDPVANSWSTLPSLPRPRAAVQAAVVGGRLLIGGDEAATTGVTDEIDVYDPVANAWSVLPLSASAGSGLAVDGASLWAISGGAVSRSDDFVAGAWRTLTSTTQTVGRGPGVLIGAQIFVFGEFATLRYTMADEIR